MWPSTNAPLTTAEILEILDAEITGTLWPQLHASQGDWHLTYLDRSLVAEQRLYRMPKRMWGPIKDLLIVDSTGKETSLELINVEELGRMGTVGTSGGAERFVAYVDGDAVGLYPLPAEADTALSLRERYYRAPNALCLAADARQIVEGVFTVDVTNMSTVGLSGLLANVTIDTGSGYTPAIGDSLSLGGSVSGVVVLVTDATHFRIDRDNSNIGTGDATMSLGPNRLKVGSTVDWTALDVIGAGVSHQVLGDELAISAVDGTIITLEDDYPSLIEVGDWVSEAGTTPLAQVPDHLVPQLVQAAATVCLASGGDQAGFARSAAMQAKYEQRGMPTIDPRQEAEPRVIVPRNSPFQRWRR